MSENLTFAELEAQHVELLPDRTVMSLISLGKPGKPGTPGTPGTPGKATQGISITSGGCMAFVGTFSCQAGVATPGPGGTASGG